MQKKQQKSPLQSLPGETKTAEQLPQKNKQAKKRKNNLKWGLWGLLFYTAYRKPNFYCRKEVIIRFSIG